MEPGSVWGFYPRSTPIVKGRTDDLTNARALNSHLYEYVRNPIPNPPKNRQGFMHIARQPYSLVDGVYSVRIQPPPKFPGFGHDGRFTRSTRPGDIPSYKLAPTLYQ